MPNLRIKVFIGITLAFLLVVILAGLMYKLQFSQANSRVLESQQSKKKEMDDLEVLKKIKALEDLYQAGLLTKDEYESKKQLLLSSGKPSNSATNDQSSDQGNYKAPDGSFSCMLPEGWNTRVADLQGSPVHMFEPPDSNGQQVIMVLTGSIDPSIAGQAIERLAQSATYLMYQNFPGVVPQGQPRFFKVNGDSATELSYAGQNRMTGADLRVWNGVMEKDQTYYGVLAVTDPAHAEKLHAQAKALFQTIRPASGSDATGQQRNRSVEAALVGTWTYYHGSGGMSGSGSVSKSMTFYSNGTYSYTSSVSISARDAGSADSERNGQGTYQVVGTSSLIFASQSGERSTVRIQLVQQGGYVQAIIANGEKWLREQ